MLKKEYFEAFRGYNISSKFTANSKWVEIHDPETFKTLQLLVKNNELLKDGKLFVSYRINSNRIDKIIKIYVNVGETKEKAEQLNYLMSFKVTNRDLSDKDLKKRLDLYVKMVNQTVAYEKNQIKKELENDNIVDIFEKEGKLSLETLNEIYRETGKYETMGLLEEVLLEEYGIAIEVNSGYMVNTTKYPDIVFWHGLDGLE